MATKTDLVNSVSNVVGITKTDTLTVINSVFSELGNLLISDGVVQIADFGKFVVKVTAQRNGRNPRIGAAIVIPAKTRVRFSPFKVPLRMLWQRQGLLLSLLLLHLQRRLLRKKQ